MTSRPDRNDEPGLRSEPLNIDRARQITGHYVETTAVHSRSEGWIPMLKLDIEHEPLIGSGPRETLELLIRPEDWDGLVKVVRESFDRAWVDAMFGLGGKHRWKR